MKNQLLHIFSKVCVFFTLFLISAVTMGETLVDALHDMAHTNPVLLEAYAREKAACHAFQKKYGELLPNLYAEYNVGRGKGQSFSPQTFNLPFTVRNIQHKKIGINQFIFDGGVLSNAVRGIYTEYQSAYYDTKSKMDELALKVASAFIALKRSQEIQVATRVNLSSHRRILGQINERFRSGVGNLSEYVLTQTRYDQAVLALNRAQLEERKALASYNEVIGHLPVGPLVFTAIPCAKLPTSLGQAKCQIQTNNPSLISHNYQILASKYKVRSENANLYFPKVHLELSASKDLNLNGVPQRLTSTQGYFVMTYSFFRGGSDLAAVREADEHFIASKGKFMARNREIFSSLEQTWDELVIAKKDYAVLIKRVSSTNELLNTFRQEFFLAKRSLLDVMNTENELLTSKLALIDAKYRIKTNQYAILALTGQLSNFLNCQRYCRIELKNFLH